MEKFKGLPGIKEFLSEKGDGAPVGVRDIPHIVDNLQAHCGLSKEQSERVLSLFFQEIRSAMLAGEVVDIRTLGMFYISSPKTTKSKRKVSIRFKVKKTLRDLL